VLLLGLGTPERASAVDAFVTNYGYPGCEHSISTNHFYIAPGEVFEFWVDLSQCTPSDLGGVLFFGYKTTKNQSRQLEIRDGIALKILDPATREEIDYELYGGYNGAGRLEHVYMQMAGPGKLLLSAENTLRRETLKIRLRVESGL
jgi:hypothetical protein